MLKILEIKQTNNPFHGTNKSTGKPYDIYSWLANFSIDGQNIQGVVKSFQNIDFNQQKEFEFTKNEYHNPNTGNIDISYTLKPIQQKKQWNSKPSYTLQEYDLLFQHAMKKFEIKFKDIPITDIYQKWEIIQKLVSTYCIGATNAGVKIEIKPEQKPNPPMNISDKPEVMDNPFSSDESIPF